MADNILLDKVGLRLGGQHFRFDGSLPGGAITAITGPSGAGKSTLLNLLAGFEIPDQGRVLMGGTDVSGAHPSQRPVSLVFQDNNLFAHLDVFTNVALGIHPSLKLREADRQVVLQALQRVGLDGFAKRMPGTLSGGEKQRAAFARALVRQKPVLLLDEPFAALDPGLGISMAKLLLELHRETANTVIIVTHDPQEVARLADYAVFVESGAITLQAPAAEFLARQDLPALTAFLSG
ncbi:ATP-binding cassette domain-containing protein [Rhizobium deserti]|uniref:ATP-binding cassette domain-containing protein n=1 Tax=Rhizobium deserti TaxID=2547961 RepID=A0A4R5UFY1_9HYPH|nr:ATP-binding cassette domain-containing protein [Rhizobium deserti]TDK34412.1 ATP-binding cassette domain-containing protein [Rhizobium deserti]